MAATGKTPILLYGSTTATNQPSAGNLTNSSDGCEIAINVADKNLFFKDSTNTVNTVPVRQSSASSDGWLSSTDWSTFNNKQPAGSYLTSVTADAPLTGAGTSGSHLSIPAASGSTNGYLSSTDWTTFNNKQPAGTYVTSVTGTAPVVSSGGTTPAISMAAATGSVNGYLTSADWTTFNSKQAALVSGTNIKTVSGVSLLGSGDVGTIGTGYGGTGLTSFTANGVMYASSTSVLATGNKFIFDGNNIGLNLTTSPTANIDISFKQATNGINVGAFVGTSTDAGAIPVIQSFGSRNDGNGSFGGRYGAASRRMDGTAIPSGWQIGVFGFGGQYGTDTTYQSSKLLYAASVVGVAEGNFTASNAMPTGLSFRTGSVGESLGSVNTTYGTERMRVFSSGGVSIGNTTDPGTANLSVSGNVVIATSGKGITTGSSIPLGFGTNTSTSQMTLGTSGNLLIGTTTQANSSQVQNRDNCQIASNTPANARQYDISKVASVANATPINLFTISRASASGYTAYSQLSGTLYISMSWVDSAGGQSGYTYIVDIGVGSTNSNNLTLNQGTPYSSRIRNGGATTDTITIDFDPASTTSSNLRITISSSVYAPSSGTIVARFVGVGTGNDANRMLSVVPA